MAYKLRDDSKTVWIPNAFFVGYFTQYIHNLRNVDTDKDPGGRFINGDRFIDEIMTNSEMNPKVEMILDRICDPNFISTKAIQDHINLSFNELRRREWTCDIKILDYIEENFQDRQIFFNPNHPSLSLLLEITRRILRFIGMRSDNFLDLPKMVDDENPDWSLYGQDVPLYPSVRKVFDFQSEPKTFWANRYFWDFHGGFRDFSREYIKWCWAEKFQT